MHYDTPCTHALCSPPSLYEHCQEQIEGGCSKLCMRTGMPRQQIAALIHGAQGSRVHLSFLRHTEDSTGR